MATSNSFMMESLSDSLLAAVTETSFNIPTQPPVSGKFFEFHEKIFSFSYVSIL